METTVLRIYMTVSAQKKGQRTFWQKLFGVSLSRYLLKQAKVFGIQQATYQRQDAGYLNGKDLVFDQGEVSPTDLPQCIELIDKEEILKSFLDKYQNELDGCRVVLFKADILK